jgi:acetyl-CoA C-acetyltransferase
MHSVVILSGMRTPFGSFQGALSSLTAPQLGAHALRAALEAAGIGPGQVDEVLFGCVLGAALGQAPARQAAKGAGIPDSVPCTTINKVCGSGMKTVMMAAQAIKAGDAEIVAAGGMESMTNAPYAMPSARAGARMGHAQMLDLMIHDGLWDPYSNQHMGSCGDACAREEGFSREEIDAYAAESYRRALDGRDRLAAEISPMAIPQRKGDPVMVSDDEEPGRGNPAKLPELRPAFSPDGATTAGNASSINDGAAALILASSEAAERHGLRPLARVAAYAQHAQEPERFTTAPAAAIQKLLAKAGLEASEIDLFEVNEAFSVVAMHAARECGIPHDKLNVNGGAVSLGHPIGATGARLILTALHELRRRGGRRAVATPCIGGGEATAVLIEALD